MGNSAVHFEEDFYVIASLIVLLTLCLVLPTSSAWAGSQVPFRGTWQGSTVSATPISPTVVLVVASGSGNATRLGNFVMTSPHYTYLDTLTIVGTQIFTAANGDMVTATISGSLAPNPDGSLEGTLTGTITGGTGRFQGATGHYDFHIIARPAGIGFDSTATINGTISSIGSNK